MTRDSAAIAVLDDRRRRLCLAADEGASPPPSSSDGVAATGASSSGCGGCDASSKSSSAASTTASSPSTSGSDDDDGFSAVRCPPAVRRPDRDDVSVAHRQTPSGGRFDNAAAVAPANIGGRLTFYKDGKFIFQLAAYQQHSFNNQSTTVSPCRWMPVPVVIHQHKNSVKSVGENSLQQPQNKTIWPYLVTDQPTSNSKSPQPIQQSPSLATMKSGNRRLQLSQSKSMPTLCKPFSGAVNQSGFNDSVVTATTQNIVRRLSRKYSMSTLVENVSDLQHQNRQPQSLQLRNLTRLSQHHQNQSFMMVASKAIKALRRSKQRNSCRPRSGTGKTDLGIESLRSKSRQGSLVNLEHVVRHLWCQRHTSELLRRQLSLNNNSETAISTSSSASQRDYNDFACTNFIAGCGKRRSLISPLSTSVAASNESRVNTSVDAGSPYKKYKSREQQIVTNNSVQIGASVVPANNHSITAILSGNVTGTKRCNDVVSSITDSNICFSTNTTSTYSNSINMPQKTILPAQPSLLRTLLKSPSSEIVAQSVAASGNNGCYSRTFSGRKRPAIELASFVGTPEINKCSSMTAPLTTFPLPTHHSAVTDQLSAAGYFNVLYHQAALAAAMVYQNNPRLPQPVQKPTPLLKPQPSALLSMQFSNTNGVNSNWQHQLNRRPFLLPLPEMVTGNEVASSAVSISSSVSTIVAPRTSPLTNVIVNSGGLMPPNVSSSPPLLKHSVRPRDTMLKHMQERQNQRFQPAPSILQLSLYNEIKQRQMGNCDKINTEDCVDYGGNIAEKYEIDDEKSASSVDCMPLNLSKDSAVESANCASTTEIVR